MGILQAKTCMPKYGRQCQFDLKLPIKWPNFARTQAKQRVATKNSQNRRYLKTRFFNSGRPKNPYFCYIFQNFYTRIFLEVMKTSWALIFGSEILNQVRNFFSAAKNRNLPPKVPSLSGPFWSTNISKLTPPKKFAWTPRPLNVIFRTRHNIF